MLGGQCCMTVSRQTMAAASKARITTTLPTHASSKASGTGCFAAKGGAIGDGGSTEMGMGAGCSSGTGSITGGGMGTGAHWVPQRAQRTARPGASGAGTSYSAAQEGQVIRTARSCVPAPALATNRAHVP